jgi:hypothetical protein
VLARLLHAAALGDRSMRDVLAWVADPENTAREVTNLRSTTSCPPHGGAAPARRPGGSDGRAGSPRAPRAMPTRLVWTVPAELAAVRPRAVAASPTPVLSVVEQPNAV